MTTLSEVELLQKKKLEQVVVAMHQARNLGRHLQEAIPSLGNEYRAGTYYRTLAHIHSISQRFHVTEAVAINAVRFAIAGFPYEEGYGGLLSQEERLRVAQSHRVNNGKKVGEVNGPQLRADGKGIFALSRNQLVQNGIRGGRIAGEKNYKEGTGIHARSEQDRFLDSQKGGKKAACLKLGYHG